MTVAGFVGMCGVCCMCLSIWGIIQLSLMGVFYYIETPILIEDVEEHHAKGFKDYISKTRDNYRQNALNCWAAAGAYGFTFILSITCIVSVKRRAKREALLKQNDELMCQSKMVKPPQTVDAPVDKALQKRIKAHEKLVAKAERSKGRGKPKEIPKSQPPGKPQRPGQRTVNTQNKEIGKTVKTK